MKDCIKLIFVLTLFLPAFLSAQVGVDDKKARLNAVTSNEAIEMFDLTERISIRKFFYNTEWKAAHILGNEQVAGKDLLIKYDILNQQINVNIQQVAMVASNRVLSGFVFLGTRQKFIYIEPGNWTKGKTFFEVLEEGEYALLVHHSAKKLKANYNAALDTGSKSETITQKEAYYVMKADKVFEIPQKKKAAEKFFSKYSKATKYLKNNKVKFKNKEDLQGLIRYLNNEKNN